MSYKITKTSLLSLAVLLALSSCGKSKELRTQDAPAPEKKSSTPTAPATPPTTIAVPTPTSPQPAAPTNLVPPSDGLQPADNSTGFDNDVLPPLPTGPAGNSTADNSNVLRPPLTPAAKQTQKAYEINFSNQEAVKTGGQSKDLFYTTAGMDGLMPEFKAYSTKVSADQQKTNLNLAKAIVTAKLSRAKSSGDVTLEITVDESLNATGVVKVYRLKATNDSNMMKLAVASTGGGALEFQGGFLKCLDVDGGCENAYAKIKMSGAYTRIVFRNAFADMHFLVQENVSANYGFDLMNTYIANTANGAQTSERIDTLQVSSFEVLNGRAGMGALLTTKDKEIIGLSIPLVVSGTKSEVDASVAKISDLTKNYDLATSASSYSQKLAQQITDVRLVNNNGLGQLKLKLAYNKGSDSAAIWMVVAKVQKPELSIEQVREFESKVKAF